MVQKQRGLDLPASGRLSRQGWGGVSVTDGETEAQRGALPSTAGLGLGLDPGLLSPGPVHSFSGRPSPRTASSVETGVDIAGPGHV